MVGFGIAFILYRRMSTAISGAVFYRFKNRLAIAPVALTPADDSESDHDDTDNAD